MEHFTRLWYNGLKNRIMAEHASTFQQYNLPAIITGIFLIAGIIITYYLSKADNKLASREKTEVRSPDGTISRRTFETFK